MMLSLWCTHSDLFSFYEHDCSLCIRLFTFEQNFYLLVLSRFKLNTLFMNYCSISEKYVEQVKCLHSFHVGRCLTYPQSVINDSRLLLSEFHPITQTICSHVMSVAPFLRWYALFPQLVSQKPFNLELNFFQTGKGYLCCIRSIRFI